MGVKIGCQAVLGILTECGEINTSYRAISELIDSQWLFVVL